MTHFAAVLLALSATGSAHADPAVWHWQDCASPQFIRVTIELDRARLLDATLPVCRVDRKHVAIERKQRIIDFPAAQLASRLGIESPKNLTGNIWEAGAESNGLILGVSFQTEDQVLLNTLHPVQITDDSRSEIAPGVVVSTSALSSP